jgi:hypothetical protein
MSGARGRRRARRGAIALLAFAGCLAGRGPAPLPPAGSNQDDGGGQLARASFQIRLDEGADLASEQARVRSEPRRTYFGRSPVGWQPGSGLDPSLAGSVYGLDTSVGGETYGLVMGSVGFGIVGPTTPPRTAGDDGAVLGVVSWRGDRGVAWPEGCAGARVAKAGGAVAGAVVYLADAPLRRGADDDDRVTTTRAAVSADGCALWPPAQAIGPLPALVEIENGAQAPLVLSAGSGGAVTLEGGGRRTLVLADVAPVRIDAGERAPAWLLGQPHDQVTVTDALGRFALDDVPAGTYELVIWYPPLVRSVEGTRPVWTEPTTVRRTVTVWARGVARVAVALAPAP